MHVRLWNTNGYFKFCIKINRSEIIRLVKQIIFYATDNKSLMMKKPPYIFSIRLIIFCEINETARRISK